ncbi:hypothetical protein, partial [Parvimonas micra]|uniref:hypothetical protein n=1 Tax=Parvimonas micra TaxID=33033 RepID=UPI002B45AF45
VQRMLFGRRRTHILDEVGKSRFITYDILIPGVTDAHRRISAAIVLVRNVGVVVATTMHHIEYTAFPGVRLRFLLSTPAVTLGELVPYEVPLWNC